MALAPLVFLPPSRLATSATDSHFWSGQKQDCYAIRAIDPRPEGRGFPHAGLHNLAIIAAQDVLAEQELDAATLAPNLTHATHLVRLYLPQLLEDPTSIDRIGPALFAGIAGQISKRRPGKPAPPRKPNRKKPRRHRAYK